MLFTIFTVYMFAGFLGAFLLPRLMPAALLKNLVYHAKHFETDRRDRFFKSLVAPLIRLNIHPNVITISGFLLVLATAYGFLYEANTIFLFFAALLAGLSDMFDGILARASGKVTTLGGALDGARDFALFFTLTAWFIAKDYVPYHFILWFIVGAGLIELLKIAEIIKSGTTIGINPSLKRRLSGVGKLSIDRAKFFFYIAGCLGVILGKIWLPAAYLGYALIAIAVLLVWISILCHFILFKIENEVDMGAV